MRGSGIRAVVTRVRAEPVTPAGHYQEAEERGEEGDDGVFIPGRGSDDELGHAAGRNGHCVTHRLGVRAGKGALLRERQGKCRVW